MLRSLMTLTTIAALLASPIAYAEGVTPEEEIAIDRQLLPTAVIFDNLEEAVVYVLKKEKPTVVAFGEMHIQPESAHVQSTLSRFVDLLPAIAPEGAHLLVETWLPKTTVCRDSYRGYEVEFHGKLSLPDHLLGAPQCLLRHGVQHGYTPHGLDFSCYEWSQIYRDGPRAPDERMWIRLVTEKTAAWFKNIYKTKTKDAMIILYGGSMHNEFYPKENEFAAFSYAREMNRATQGGYVEIDIYLPELLVLLGKLPAVMGEFSQWYEAYASSPESKPNKVFVYRRSRNSYVIIPQRSHIYMGLGAKHGWANEPDPCQKPPRKE